jgi:hypothetical protein
MQELGITDNAGAMRVLAASQALAQGKKRWGNKTGYGEDLIAMEDTDLRLRTSTRAMPINWCHNLGKSELFSQIRLLQLYKWFSSGSSKLFARPLHGAPPPVMKIAEFASGGFGYVLSGAPQSAEGSNKNG